MSRHQHTGVNHAAISAATLFEPREIWLIIFFGEKDGLKTVFAPDRVRGNARKTETWFIRHFNTLFVEVISGNQPEYSAGCFYGY
ncbi:MAG: hypothetical protein PVG47_09925 [Chromatiales bacterium]